MDEQQKRTQCDLRSIIRGRDRGVLCDRASQGGAGLQGGVTRRAKAARATEAAHERTGPGESAEPASWRKRPTGARRSGRSCRGWEWRRWIWRTGWCGTNSADRRRPADRQDRSGPVPLKEYLVAVCERESGAAAGAHCGRLRMGSAQKCAGSGGGVDLDKIRRG